MKVLCVGRNYVRHVKELGGQGGERPVWFWKPDTAVVGDGEPVAVPAGIGAVHHEVELAVRVAGELRRVPAAAALRHVDALTVAVDVTARDLQDEAKRAGAPWDQAKGYDTFLPLGPWVPLAGHDLQALRLRLSVNGQVRQDGSTADMTWPVASCWRGPRSGRRSARATCCSPGRRRAWAPSCPATAWRPRPSAWPGSAARSWRADLKPS